MFDNKNKTQGVEDGTGVNWPVSCPEKYKIFLTFKLYISEISKYRPPELMKT